jgi:hypothetical protein
MVCFQTKNPNLGKFLESLAMEDVGIFYIWTLGPLYGLLLYFMDIWYSSWKFGIFFPNLVFCAKKILATLATSV